MISASPMTFRNILTHILRFFLTLMKSTVVTVRRTQAHLAR